MKNRYIRLLVILGSIAITGIVVVQVFWLRKAFDLREKQFNYNVTLALDNIVSALCEYNQTDVPSENPIEQVAGNYFVVRTNNVIPPRILESLLTTEFQKRIIQSDFEFTIYDCSNQQVIYKDYINQTATKTEKKPKKHPNFKENEYYFDVFFPHKTASLVNQMGIWIFSSSVMLIVIVFFAVAVAVILRQKRMSEIQRDFVNNMAHEFNTPISSIGLAADYFRKQSYFQDTNKEDAYLSIIENENLKLKKHVEEILQIGKYEQQEYQIKMVPIPLMKVINEAYEDIERNYPNNNLIYQVSGPKDVKVLGDQFHLKNVFYNLFENVVKYCQNSGQVNMQLFTDSKHAVSLNFKDQGKGISKKYKNRIFNRFFRVPTGDLQQVKGFGMGLFYVRFILKKMNGAIRLVSSGAEGTVFNLKFKKP